MSFTAGYVVNEGTEYEFTVSDETISEVVQDTGISESDIAEYCYSALIDTRVAKIVATQHHTSFEPDWESIVKSNYYTYFPTTSPLTSAVPTFNKDLLNTTDKVYQRNFLMWYGTIYPGTPQEKTGEFLVMDMVDIKKWYLDFNDAGFSTTPVSVTSSVNDQIPLPEGYTWQGYTGDAYRYVSNTIAHASMKTVTTADNVDKNLFVINVINFNDQLAIGELNPSSHGQSDIGMEDIMYAGMRDEWLNRYGGYFNPSSPQRSYQGVSGDWGAVGDYRGTPIYPAAPRGDLINVSFESWAELSNDDMLYQITGNWGQQNANCAMQGSQLSITKDMNIFLKWQSWCGLLFEFNGTRYKPIIQQGVVIGYSSDMTKESEWDDMTNVTGNNISPTPPTPIPDPWDVDPETYGWSGGEVSGMVKYYLLTSGQMGDLQAAIASNANWTIDYLNCIVSCFVVPNSGIFFDAPIPTTVKFKLDNATEWNTGVGCARIQGTINKSGGTIVIPRLTNTFYDFEPYSDYSVYIPFCGRIPIKGNLCLGREIKVTYYPDVPTCSLTAVVSCGGATIAIAKGSFGTMTPITSNGSDRKTAAVIGDVTPIITGIGTGIVGVALGNPLIVGAGAAQALGGIMGGVKETVQSYAYSVGSTGDSSFFSAGNRCYYYANYPLIDEVVNNSMFGHSVGYLCNKVGKLKSFTGFTLCANPHVTFSASAEEREEIEKLLSMGVIL